MKKYFNYKLLLLVVLAATVAAAGIAVNSRLIKSSSETAGEMRERGRAIDKNADKGEEGGEGEEVAARLDWFLQQRLYGSQEIPAEARERAKTEADLVAPPASDAVFANQWSSIGPKPTESSQAAEYGDVSGRINWIAVHPTDNNIALLGTATGGVWRSTNALAAVPTFAPVSDSQTDLAVGSIAFAASSPSTVYAAMGDLDNSYLGSGVLKSTDAGATWTRTASANLPLKGFGIEIAVKSDDPNTVFLARGELTGQLPRNHPSVSGVAGFYRTTDGGATWTQTLNGRVTSFVVKPDNQNVIYAAVLTSSQTDAVTKGIYKSIDAGQTFAAVPGAPDLGDATDFRVAASPANAQKIYFYGGKSLDGQPASDPPPAPPAPIVGTQLYVLTDDGTTATFTNNFVPLSQLDAGQFDYNTYLVADRYTAGRIYIGSRDVFQLNINAANNVASVANLTNAYVWNGTKWAQNQNASSKAHADQQHLAFLGDSASYFIANDGGLARTVDTGATFTKNLNQSLSLAQVVGLTFNTSDPTKVYIGAQDNGSQRFLGGMLWKEYNGGDGGQTRVDPVDKSRVYGSYIYGQIYRQDNNATASEIVVHPTINNPAEPNPAVERVAFYPPIEVNGVDGALYLGTQSVKVCTNCNTAAGTGNWTYPSNPGGVVGTDVTRGGSDVLSAMAIQKTAYGNTQVIYTGSGKGAFAVSQNGGATFTNQTTNLDAAVHNGNVPMQNPGRFISNIKIDPAEAGTAYISVSGFGTQHLFKSTNYGATIVALNFTVDIPANDFLIDPMVATTFYIATDIGIFRSLDSGATWGQYNFGLPPVVVNRLEGAVINTTFAPMSRVLAGTYGRGVYQVDTAPTAASVTIGGRVLSATGRSVAGATVSLTEQNGTSRVVRTNSLGYYAFRDVSAGQTCVFQAAAKKQQFEPQVISITESIERLDFRAQ